jgi:hypothetical protein
MLNNNHHDQLKKMKQKISKLDFSKKDIFIRKIFAFSYSVESVEDKQPLFSTFVDDKQPLISTFFDDKQPLISPLIDDFASTSIDNGDIPILSGIKNQ